jgi:nucleoside-triphosphatase
MRKNIIITGMPGYGKSTLLKSVIAQYFNKTGFITNEIRKDSVRVGFEIETSHNKKSILAHVNFNTDHKVSKYYVDVKNLDEIIPDIKTFNDNALLYIDEIGQMELLSENFKNLVNEYLDSKNTCIATLSHVYHNDFTEKIRNRDDVIIVEISKENRDAKLQYVNTLLCKISKARRYVSFPVRFTFTDHNNASIKTDHGVRQLTFVDHKWACVCDFYKDNYICSHIIALEEIVKMRE